MHKITLIGGLTLILLCGGCTEPGRTTAIGAAAGTAVGAGLGAIVGNQVGDAGSGVAIGALAGAGLGGGVGNAFEAQEKTIRAQDEAIERQERMLLAQRSQIDELQRIADENVKFKPYAARSPAVKQAGPAADGADTPAADPRGAYQWPAAAPSRAADAPARGQPPCAEAENEVARVKSAPVTDRLFHYRRALRLCPGSAEFHNGLGETYAEMKRRDDAVYEFREALRIDPGFARASENLNRSQP